MRSKVCYYHGGRLSAATEQSVWRMEGLQNRLRCECASLSSSILHAILYFGML
jgi:hypothetical protein